LCVDKQLLENSHSLGSPSDPLGLAGQTGPAEPLNQSTGYALSSAIDPLPKLTGSHSCRSPNLPPRRVDQIKRGPALSRHGRGLMSEFARGVVGVFAVGMIVGVGALMLVPQSSPSAMRFAEPPARPCSQQTWPTNDRICQKWTAPRRSDAHGAADTPAPLANAQPGAIRASTRR
jgi:hypothetical protein